MIKVYAGIAQSVEQLIRNEKVGGSIPLSGTNKINDLAQPLRWALLFLGIVCSRHRSPCLLLMGVNSDLSTDVQTRCTEK